MRLRPRTLGAQLIVVTALAIFISNAAVALWFALGNERQNEAQMVEHMLDRGPPLTTLMANIPPKARVAAADALQNRFWRYSIRTGKHNPEPMSADEAKLAARLKTMLPQRYAGQPVEVHFRTVRQTEDEHGPPPLSARGVEMTLPVVRGTELIVTFLRPPGPPWPAEMAMAAILAALIASAAGAYMARAVARPLAKLADAAALVGRGEMPPRVPEEGPDDVRRAAEAFNTMTDQVTRTLASQRQLLSAVGHDLRTPITAMRINIEFVEDGDLRERLQRNLDELQALTEAVLSAAKGTGGEAKRQVDLAALGESICNDLGDLGEPVVWHSHDPAPLACHANEIRRALRNLVENAVRYGGKAEVSLHDVSGAYELWVEDEGPGIPAEDRERVFEPFVRLESSRNVETGGTGLGLTLVKAIAESHDGRVTLEDRPGGGLRARLVLPRQAQRTTARLSKETL
ncbi:MAG: ATP-binding protein [Rhizomicrobium sp.]|nr:ATP-binding protein [Rhizomicrobium sp.]